MRTIARIIYKLGDIIDVAVQDMGTVFITASLACLLYSVFMRKTWGIGIVWGEDFIKYTALWGIFLCTGIATRYRTHIKIDVLVVNAKGTFKTVLLWMELVLGVALAIYLSILSVQFVALLYQKGTITISRLIPQWMATASFSAACILLSFYYIEHIMMQLYPRERLGLPPLKRPGTVE